MIKESSETQNSALKTKLSLIEARCENDFFRANINQLHVDVQELLEYFGKYQYTIGIHLYLLLLILRYQFRRKAT